MAANRDVAREPIQIPFPLSLFFIPVLFIAVALSYPYQAVVEARLRRRERRFEAEMSAAKRTMVWDGSPQSLADRGGTLVEEWFGPKGPLRWWWTGDDIGAISPHPFTDDLGLALFDETYDAFSAWCQEQYVSEHGTALFVASSHGNLSPAPRTSRDVKLGIPVVVVKSNAALKWAQR